jgi:hypothetical protein
VSIQLSLHQHAIRTAADITRFFSELNAVEDYTMSRVLTEGERAVLRDARSILNELYHELTGPQEGANHGERNV